MQSFKLAWDLMYEDLSFNSETGHDRNLKQLLHNVTHFVPKQTVKQWKLCQRASTCANVPIMTSLRITRMYPMILRIIMATAFDRFWAQTTTNIVT